MDTVQVIRGAVEPGMWGVSIDLSYAYHHIPVAERHTHFLAFQVGSQKYKYVVHNVAAAYGKTATFMPKPIKGDNGSGMHVNQSIWKDGKPLFAGNSYADLSDEAFTTSAVS